MSESSYSVTLENELQKLRDEFKIMMAQNMEKFFEEKIIPVVTVGLSNVKKDFDARAAETFSLERKIDTKTIARVDDIVNIKIDEEFLPGVMQSSEKIEIFTNIDIDCNIENILAELENEMDTWTSFDSRSARLSTTETFDEIDDFLNSLQLDSSSVELQSSKISATEVEWDGEFFFDHVDIVPVNGGDPVIEDCGEFEEIAELSCDSSIIVVCSELTSKSIVKRYNLSDSFSDSILEGEMSASVDSAGEPKEVTTKAVAGAAQMSDGEFLRRVWDPGVDTTSVHDSIFDLP